MEFTVLRIFYLLALHCHVLFFDKQKICVYILFLVLCNVLIATVYILQFEGGTTDVNCSYFKWQAKHSLRMIGSINVLSPQAADNVSEICRTKN